MASGLLIGNYGGDHVKDLGTYHIYGVSLPIAIGLWLMMLPVLVKVKYELLPQLLITSTIGMEVLFSTFVNWVIGPALMTGLALLCLPDLDHLRNGVILIGIARCIAMVLVWNDLADGNLELCAILVAVNSILQVILYTPFTYFYLNIASRTSIHVGFWTVARSVFIFLGIPLVGGVGIRYSICYTKGKEWLNRYFIPLFSPVALIALLYTIIIMFAIQGEKIVKDASSVARVSIPLVLYFAVMFFSTLLVSTYRRISFENAITHAFTAAGNNFELAIAIAVATFGIDSDEALAATIGPLIEVPVLLVFVYVCLCLKPRSIL
jgi:ACR3 family arsenite transporter